MLQVTVELIFNISLGLIFCLILISCKVVVMTPMNPEARAETCGWDATEVSTSDLPTHSLASSAEKVPLKKMMYECLHHLQSQPKGDYGPAAGASGQGTVRNQKILLYILYKV